MEQYQEIVKVLNDSKLIDCESFERGYRTASGAPLVPGFYIVSWPGAVESQAYDHSARYVGPYKFQLHATLALAHEAQLVRIDARTDRG